MTVDQNTHNRPFEEVHYWKGTAALTLGIVSVAVFWLFGWPSMIMGVLAIVFGIKSQQAYDFIHVKQLQPTHPKTGLPISKGVATSGFVLGIIGIVLGAMRIFIWLSTESGY